MNLLARFSNTEWGVAIRVPRQGHRILSQVLNRAFSRYSSLAAHFSRLVSIPRRQLVSRSSSPTTNRRITLRFVGA
jgi:hypothetical protein